MNERMVHQLLIIKKKEKILFQQKKVNTEKNTACTYDYYYPKPSMKFLCFEVKKKSFCANPIFRYNCNPYLQFFLLLLMNQTINEMNVPPSSYFYELTEKRINIGIPQLLYCRQFLFSSLNDNITQKMTSTTDEKTG